MKKVKFEFKPVDGRKSFYGKAKVVHYSDGLTILHSYETPVCAINENDCFVRLWDGWIATTARHVNAFLTAYSFPTLSKSEWLMQPLGHVDVIAHDLMVLRTMQSA